MPDIIIAGNTGKDAEYKQTQSGSELCSFSVADESGFGDDKQTLWFDVTSWGKGARKLADILRKGSKVKVTGELSTREHNGKTYLQCRAYNVKILGTPQGGSSGGSGGASQPNPNAGGGNSGGYDDLGDDIPFATSGGIW